MMTVEFIERDKSASFARKHVRGIRFVHRDMLRSERVHASVTSAIAMKMIAFIVKGTAAFAAYGHRENLSI